MKKKWVDGKWKHPEELEATIQDWVTYFSKLRKFEDKLSDY